MAAPTNEELTRAFLVALKGDDKLTAEDRAYVRDVMRRDAEDVAERLRVFLRNE